MNTISKIKINYQLSKEDYLEAMQISVLKYPGFAFYTYLLLLIAGFLDLIRIKNPNFMIIQYFQNTNNYSTPSDYLVYGLFQIIIGCLLLINQFFPKINPLLNWKFLQKYNKNFVVKEIRNVEINDTQLSLVLDSYREIRSWENYIKFVESSKIFLLYYSKEKYQIIPKRAFTTTSDLELFRNLLQNKITT